MEVTNHCFDDERLGLAVSMTGAFTAAHKTTATNLCELCILLYRVNYNTRNSNKGLHISVGMASNRVPTFLSLPSIW